MDTTPIRSGTSTSVRFHLSRRAFSSGEAGEGFALRPMDDFRREKKVPKMVLTPFQAPFMQNPCSVCILSMLHG
jgi:hypothetical protein